MPDQSLFNFYFVDMTDDEAAEEGMKDSIDSQALSLRIKVFLGGVQETS